VKKLFVANWKMNKTRAEALEFREGLSSRAADFGEVEVAIAPPFPFLIELLDSRGRWSTAGQNCSAEPAGAFTGEVSASMLASSGCRYVILGHSERRKYFGETEPILALKLERAREAGLVPIFCVGETQRERAEGLTREVLVRHLEALANDPPRLPLVVAYEPVWAIGTGQNATPEQAGESIAAIRRLLPGRAELRVLYGGSVTPGNSASLLRQPGIDGFLIGGASLDAVSFCSICASGRRSGAS
jgi:triosephosphate isomerase